MGSTLSASEDRGHGWLASSIASCAPVLRRRKSSRRSARTLNQSPRLQDAESPQAFDAERSTLLPTEQPHLPSPVEIIQRPQTSHSGTQRSIRSKAHLPCFRLPASRRTFSLRRPWTSNSCRPTISGPTDFRRLEEPSSQRIRSFKPLQLRIHQIDGRLSPLPDFDTLHKDAEDSRLSRQAPWRPRSLSLPLKLQSTFKIPRKALELRRTDIEPGSPPPRPPFPPRNSSRFQDHHQSPSLTTFYQQSSTTSHELIATTISQFPQPPSSALVRNPSSPKVLGPLSRRSSDRSLRRLKSDIDEAILELQTVVEEKRATARVVPTSSATGFYARESTPKYHVPAIAPSMKVRARSQTLSDIGSAFSRPLTPKTPHAVARTAEAPLPEMPRLVSQVGTPRLEPKGSEGLHKKHSTRITVSQLPLESETTADAGSEQNESHYREPAAALNRLSIASTSSINTALTSSTVEAKRPLVSAPDSSHGTNGRPSTHGNPSISKTPSLLIEEAKPHVQIRIKRKQGGDVLKVHLPPPAYAVEDPHPSPRRVGMAL